MNQMEPTVYIVDEDQSFRTAIGRLRSASAYRVALYEQGKQFLEQLRGNEAGCILLDLDLTGFSGL